MRAAKREAIYNRAVSFMRTLNAVMFGVVISMGFLLLLLKST